MVSNPINKKQGIKLIIGIIIMVIIGSIHAFRIGSYLNGDYYIYYYSYFSDLIMPFGIYFLFCMIENQYHFLKNWHVKAMIVFVGAAMTEFLQYFDIYFLGETFDWIDILMFGIGVTCAVILDTLIFPKMIPNWN